MKKCIVIFVLCSLSMYFVHSMEHSWADDSFAQMVIANLNTDLHKLCQMVACLDLKERACKVLEMDAGDLEEYKTTLDLSNRALGVYDKAEWATIEGYLKSRIELAIMQKTNIGFFATLYNRASLFVLKSLVLDNNSLTNLPVDLLSLPVLEELSARSNKFTEFPAVLYSIGTLDTINLADNEIKEINISAIGKMPKLKLLTIHNNRLTEPQKEGLTAAWSLARKKSEWLKIADGGQL